MSTQTSSDGSEDTPPAMANLRTGYSIPNMSKLQMNRMIMDYLVKHGYSQAASDFAKEAGMTLGVDINTIEQRKNIKNAIYAGDLETAINGLNEINCGYVAINAEMKQILEQNPDLHFQLLNLQLVELIKEENAKENGDIYRCTNFAEQYLAPRAPNNPVWKDQLEKTMALLVFDHASLLPTLKAVLSSDLRTKVASAANKAILEATGESSSAGLIELLQTRVFAEEEARNLNRWPPNIVGIGLDEQPAQASSSNGNNHAEDDQMAD